MDWQTPCELAIGALSETKMAKTGIYDSDYLLVVIIYRLLT